MDLKEKINDMELDLATLKQERLSNNLVIGNLPIQNNESSSLLRKIICDTVNDDRISKNIIEVYRVNNTRRSTNNKKNYQNNRVIMKLSTKSEKEYAMSIKKQICQRLSTLQSNTKGKASSIYIADQLIPFFQNLLNMAMLLKHRANFKYVWARDSKIYVKKK